MYNKQVNIKKSQDSLFIHALWRTSSTYWWEKIRENNNFVTYFDPLHESLKSKSRVQLEKDFNRTMVKFDHAMVRKDYFDEYKISEDGGVKGFQDRFTLENYAIPPDKSDPELRDYINSLIKDANQQNKRAMIKFNRSTLRGEWLKSNFGGTHIYVNRNLSDIYNSYINKNYYIPCYLGICGKNSDDPLFSELSNYLKVNNIGIADFRKSYWHYRRELKSISQDKQQEMVAFFWVTSLAKSTLYMDDFIDADLITASKEAFATTIEKLERITGAKIDTTDFRIKHNGDQLMTISNKAKEIITSAVEHINPNWNVLDEHPLSANTTKQLKMLLA